MRFLHTDPISIGMSLGGAALGQASDRTKAYEQARAGEAAYDTQSDAFQGYINKLRQELAPYLSGELTSGDLKARAQTEKKASENLTKSSEAYNQALARAGITGGAGSASVAAIGQGEFQKQYQEYLASVDAALAEKAADRQLNAKQAVMGAEGQMAQALAPIQAQTEAAKQGLRTSQQQILAPQYLAPSLLPAAIGGLGNMMGGKDFFANAAQGGFDPYGLMRQGATGQVLGQLGIDPKMFAQTPGGRDIFGNPLSVPETQVVPQGSDVIQKGTNKVLYTNYKKEGLNDIDAKKLADYDYYQSLTKGKKADEYAGAKKKYIESRNLIGQSVTSDGVTKTYKGNGEWN